MIYLWHYDQMLMDFTLVESGSWTQAGAGSARTLEAVLTVLARVQAERGALQRGAVLAEVPDVEVDEDGQGGEGSHSQPGQHEDVRQHDELQGNNSSLEQRRQPADRLQINQH